MPTTENYVLFYVSQERLNESELKMCKMPQAS